MNNEELKKKIVEILEETECEWTEEKNGYILQIFYDKLADALIAAGYGDVKEAEHRAARAERALYNACCEQNKHWCAQCDSFAECDTSNEMCVEAKKHAEELIKQAEKEIAEERK